jgi:hypothetical protein
MSKGKGKGYLRLEKEGGKIRTKLGKREDSYRRLEKNEKGHKVSQ